MDLITLPKGRSWLLRPWSEGLCPYVGLKDGSLDLADIAEMNDFLDARAENERRLAEAQRKKRRG